MKSKAPVIVWSDGEDDGDADGDVSARSGGSGSDSSRNRSVTRQVRNAAVVSHFSQAPI